MLDYLDDLESDFSRFHRVDDIYQLPAVRFFRMATRLVAYDGVMAARVNALQEKQPAGVRHTPIEGADRSVFEQRKVS